MYPQLSTNKLIKVMNSGNWEDNKWLWQMNWIRNLMADEIVFAAELLQNLSGFAPDRTSEDNIQ
jgi:hypothetical protein